ncbi:tyrosine-type recombinase/integrase [Lysinibacillus sp. GbtcB16]|uniref:tyrosine-type recombinase/integrase n=1 Tax=Lysinibacillus sp. GbtcB16 TaxID=2824761 RepID=UPI001C2F7D0D|nr:tyrosine-type recombinase/integrase [Lysinibacillus sp. GbtcB16]
MVQLQEKYNLEKITTHGLRHTHYSLLFEAGATIKEVQDRLGHTDVQTTMNIYTHVTEKAKEVAAEKFAKYMDF